MRKKTLGIVGMVVAIALASLSGGYLYAAQGGAGAQDKKQLGLFNGNDEFIGTLVGMDKDDATGGVEYQAYLNSNDSITKIKTEAVVQNSTFTLSSNYVYFNSQDCTSDAYIHIIEPNDGAQFLPQMLFPSKNPERQFVVVANDIRDNISISSKLGDGGVCETFSAEIHGGLFHVRESSSNLSFVLDGKPKIKTL